MANNDRNNQTRRSAGEGGSMKNVSTTVYGFVGNGPTLKEAKEDARQQAERALRADYDPRHIVGQRFHALIWNTPQGPNYATTEAEQPLDSTQSGHVYPASTTMDEVERDARRHLAQMDMTMDGHEVTYTGADIIKNPADKADHLIWCQWQTNYRKWREAGADDMTAHQNAGDGAPQTAQVQP